MGCATRPRGRASRCGSRQSGGIAGGALRISAERDYGCGLHSAVARGGWQRDAGQIHGSDKQAVAEQAYRLETSPAGIVITANAPLGLFYGVQTFVQILRPRGAAYYLPQCRIADGRTFICATFTGMTRTTWSAYQN